MALQTVWGRKRDIHGIEKLFAMMEEMKMRPNFFTVGILKTFTYYSLIDGFSEAGNTDKAHELFRQMIKEGLLQVKIAPEDNNDRVLQYYEETTELDPFVSNFLITGLSMARRMDEASAIVSKAKTSWPYLDQFALLFL